MEIQHKLMKLLHIMDFKLFLISLFILLLTYCKRADNTWNEIRVNNTTNKVLVLNISKKYISDIGEYFLIQPNEKIILARAIYTSDYGIIRDNWGDKRDTIEIYNQDTTKIFVKWGGPLLSLSDSIHSFYNENSWSIESGGKNDKYIIATFTITEEDFIK